MYRKVPCGIISIMLLILNTSAVPGRASLTHHWGLDESSSPYVDDVGGADATGINVPKSVVGFIGAALEFDGIDDEISASHPDKWDWGAEDSFTMSYWTKTTPGQASQSNNMVALARQGTGTNQLHWWIGCQVDTWIAYFQLRDKNRVGERVIGGPALNDGNWHLVTAVRDGPKDQNRLYVDGEFVGKLDWDYTAGFDADVPFTIGHIILSGHNYRYPAVLDDIRVYERALSEDQTRDMFNNMLPTFTKAYAPVPANGTVHEDTWVNLSWSSGDFAVSHDVYLGDDLSDVEHATRDSSVFRGNQTLKFYVAGFPGFAYPDGLAPGTKYYWRIDEVNDANPDSPWKGSVWSFSIPPKTAYNPDPADGAGITDTSVTLRWTAGFGVKLHTVYFGDDFDTVANATVGAPAGTASHNPGPLEAEKVYYWRVDEFDGIGTYKGDVWTFTTPGAVGSPQPSNGATDVAMATVLSWTAADNAASHEVYLGLDKDTVRSADTTSPEYMGSKALGTESFDAGLLEPDTTYYWRVDEVYTGNTVRGPIWTFTVSKYLLVDDFEGYTDDDAAGEAIWQTWTDGFGVADNGAQVGYLVPPYCEQTIVHGGAQSMPLFYTNEAGVTNSEGVLPLMDLRDWTTAGVAGLSLWFRGDSANAADPLYVAVFNAAGSPAVVAYDDPSAATIRSWVQWHIPLQSFVDQGINLTNVDKIAIGLGSNSGMASAGGSGTMYIDDIRLYR